jgi:hypothetical protein
MYAASPLADAVHRPGAPLLGTCSYFDAAPYQMVRTDVCPYFEIHGGLRQRLADDMASAPAPVLSRVPLVRWQNGMQYLRGTANVTPVIVATVMGALLRFDFLSDHRERAGGEFAIDQTTNLYADTSTKFENSAQLVKLGLMATVKSYEESVRLTAAARAAKSA